VNDCSRNVRQVFVLLSAYFEAEFTPWLLASGAS
jgi:hypothetical protein